MVPVESHLFLTYSDAPWGWAPNPGIFRFPPMAEGVSSWKCQVSSEARHAKRSQFGTAWSRGKCFRGKGLWRVRCAESLGRTKPIQKKFQVGSGKWERSKVRAFRLQTSHFTLHTRPQADYAKRSQFVVCGRGLPAWRAELGSFVQ